MRFSTPAGLFLIAPLVFWWMTARRRPGRGRAAAALGCTALLLILSLSGLQIRRGTAPLSIMFAVDVSDSVAAASPNPLSPLSPLTAGMQPGDRSGVVVFGAAAAVERPLDRGFEIPGTASDVRSEGTNVEQAIRVAREGLPVDGVKRIVLVSDGGETTGDALREAVLAAAEGVRIDVVMPSRQATRNLTLTRLTGPSLARAGEPFVLAATVSGTAGVRGEILVQRDKGPALRREIVMPAGGLMTVNFADRHEESGVYSYRAVIRDLTRGDPLPGAPEGPYEGTVVTVAGQPRILYASQSAGTLPAALSRRGFLVDTSEELPGSLQALLGYDGVVLDDMPPETLDSRQGDVLRHYVEQHGGGLFVLGSPRVFERGFARDDALGELLPVDLRPRAGRRAPPVALVVAFDKSGSMNDRVDGTPKIEFARQAVRRVLDSLSATDAVGVIAFDTTASPVAPLRTGNTTTAVDSTLRTIRAGGATSMAPALELALEWLESPAAAPFQKRHVLLLSDGRTPAADASRARAAVQGRGVELTAVAMGADVERTLLASLAEATGGRAFFLSDVRDLPSVVEREAMRVAGGRVVEERFAPLASPHPILAGFEPGTIPSLGGYIVSSAKPGADVPLSSHVGDPVVGTWQFGLGRVGVYTADLHSAWSASLRSWNGFEVLFAQTVRWLSRQLEHESYFLGFEERRGDVTLVLETPEPRRQIPVRDVHGSARLPDGETIALELSPSAPSRFEAPLPIDGPGPYVVSVDLTEAGVDGGRVMRGYFWPGRQEHQVSSAAGAMLRSIAEVTGGQVLDPSASPFQKPRESSYWSAGPWLSALALLVFLADLFVPADVSHLLRGWRRLRRRHSDQAAA
jgi:Mg-chelatase subunit ChlD